MVYHQKTYAVFRYLSPCGHQNGADKTIASVLFQKTHSSAPEQKENLSPQVSPTPSFGRDPDRADTAVSTIVTEWFLQSFLLAFFDFVSALAEDVTEEAREVRLSRLRNHCRLPPGV